MCLSKVMAILKMFLVFAALICALIPLIMSRNDTMFPEKNFSYEVPFHLNVIGVSFQWFSCGIALWFVIIFFVFFLCFFSLIFQWWSLMHGMLAYLWFLVIPPLQVRKRLLEFILAAFQRSPDFIALLKVFLENIYFICIILFQFCVRSPKIFLTLLIFRHHLGEARLIIVLDFFLQRFVVGLIAFEWMHD